MMNCDRKSERNRGVGGQESKEEVMGGGQEGGRGVPNITITIKPFFL